ncbi:glycosyltransferase family 2 protein [Gammaproteobacteria bacterium]|nr:glycosyltransferase family 2 protein [Gammaproteobacteria bacterium]
MTQADNCSIKAEDQPLVSVIIMSYNQDLYIEQAITSVIEQTYKNLEIIISDNGSTDQSKSIIQKFLSDSRVRFLDYLENGYITKRQNAAAHQASGEFISLLYGDDYYLPSKISNQIKIFHNLDETWGVVHGPGYILTQSGAQIMDTQSIQAHGFCLKELLDCRQGLINPISPLVRTSCYKKYPSFEEIFTEGEGLFFKFALEYQFYYHQNPEIVMRIHDDNMSKAIIKNNEVFVYCMERIQAFANFPSNLISNANHAIAYQQMITAKTLIKYLNTDISNISQLFKSAIRRDKRIFLSFSGLLLAFITIMPSALTKMIFKILKKIFPQNNAPILDDYYL